MPRTIWKYTIQPGDYWEELMPEGAQIISVQTQNSEPQMWAIVNPEHEKVLRSFAIRCTGWPFRGGENIYLGSFQLRDGALVFHVFESTK